MKKMALVVICITFALVLIGCETNKPIDPADKNRLTKADDRGANKYQIIKR